MRASRLTVMLMAAAMLAMVCGCATTGGPHPADEPAPKSVPNPAKEAEAALAGHHAALKAQDVVKMMAGISDSFTNPQGLTKSALRGFMEGAVAQGAFANMNIVMDQCEATLDEGIATFKPVIYESGMGSASYEYKLKEEADGAWRIIAIQQLY